MGASRRRSLASRVMNTWVAVGLLMLSLPGLLHLQSQATVVEDAEELDTVFTPKSEAPPLTDHSQRKPVIWLHIHKAGGTFMCKQASLENEEIVHPHKHCNYKNAKFDGIPALGKESIRLNCEKRAAIYRRQGATW